MNNAKMYVLSYAHPLAISDSFSPHLFITKTTTTDHLSSTMVNCNTVVCVKRLKRGIPEEEWDETMPLPGDIIESLTTVVDTETDNGSSLWGPDQANGKQGKSELSAQLKRLSRQGMESVWVRVRRGDALLNLKARVVAEKGAKIHRTFTICAARDDRHVAVLADLTLDECTELQEMSKKVVNTDNLRFEKSKGVEYDWKKKVGTYLPDRRSTVISSVLFMPFSHERNVEATTTRCMAWFTAAVSSGAPLIFVNIQTEPTLNSAKYSTCSDQTVTRSLSWRELSWGRQQISPKKSTASAEMVQGIRLWFLPGAAEVPVVLTLEPDETRFGMDIKRSEEGFMCIDAVAKGSAADRAGLRKLRSEASRQGHLVVISRLEGNSIAPSLVSSEGLIHCCDNTDIRSRLENAIDRKEDVQLHIMSWAELRSDPVPD